MARVEMARVEEARVESRLEELRRRVESCLLVGSRGAEEQRSRGAEEVGVELIKELQTRSGGGGGEEEEAAAARAQGARRHRPAAADELAADATRNTESAGH